jgi:hypothetical protein
MELSTTQGAFSCAATQELPSILWNLWGHGHLAPHEQQLTVVGIQETTC